MDINKLTQIRCIQVVGKHPFVSNYYYIGSNSPRIADLNNSRDYTRLYEISKLVYDKICSKNSRVLRTSNILMR